MNLDNPSIFLIATERKDIYCLEPLFSELKKRFQDVTLIPNVVQELLKPDSGAMRKLSLSRMPIIISASVSVFPIVLNFRTRSSFIAVGVEHGIAPFKGYTYSSHFLSYDAYMAPTALWRDRLAGLYPAFASRFWLGGYPRLSQLKDSISNAHTMKMSEEFSSWMEIPEDRRKLVIFSWGVDPLALQSLPDQSDTVYLLHPSSESIVRSVELRKAKCVISRPDLAIQLIANAGIVLGDFSSMTLEAAALGKTSFMFIDRRLYSSDCDLGEDFFSHRSPSFVSIPETSITLPRSDLCSLEDLRSIIRDGALKVFEGIPCVAYGGERGDVTVRKALTLSASILPPENVDNRSLCADRISEFIDQWKVLGAPLKNDDHAVRKVDAAKFLAEAYRAVLGRDIDLSGMSHYLKVSENSSKPLPIMAFNILYEIANSKEAMMRFSSGAWGWPEISAIWGSSAEGEIRK